MGKPYTFLHMGCDLAVSKDAATKTKGVTLVEQMHAGSKLSATSGTAQRNYFELYRDLLREKLQEKKVKPIEST